MNTTQYDHHNIEERRVLIIDDDKDFVEAQTELIEDKGYTVKFALNSNQAKDIIRKYDAQIAIIDQRLGSEDGVDLIKAFKIVRPKILCIVLTGFSEKDSIVKALRNGANDYLCKPIDPSVLLAVLDRCYETHKMRLITEEAIAAKLVADAENRAKSGFLSQMSHELRTPLTTILGYTELLLSETTGYLPDDRQSNLQFIKRAGFQLLDLVNKLLDLSRIEAGRVDLKIENVTINEVVDECIVLTKTIATRNNVNLVRTSVSNYTINVDRTHFKQIILNLLSNSAKYSHPFTKVEINCQIQQGSIVRLSVLAKGAALTTLQQAELFSPFDRLGAELSEIEGTGIGLVITKHLVALMEGNIGLVSEPDIGSTLWVEFPGIVGIQEIKKCEPNDNLFPENQIRHSKNNLLCKILLVEDNNANQQLLLAQLKRINCSIKVAKNGKEALTRLDSEPFDIVLTDCNMPEMSGYELCRAIREKEKVQGGHMTILAITADAMIGIGQKCERAGMDDCLTKPFVLKDLEKLIGKWTKK